MKAYIIALIGTAVMIASGATHAALLTFAFTVPFASTTCFGYSSSTCAGMTSATLFIELDIADPYASGQTWDETNVTSYDVSSNFPTANILGSISNRFTTIGSYSYNINDGTAAATILEYNWYTLGFRDGEHTIKDSHWRYSIDSPPTQCDAGVVECSVRATPLHTTIQAAAFVGAVPIPGAAFMFISALTGLVGAKRLARKRRVSAWL